MPPAIMAYALGDPLDYGPLVPAPDPPTIPFPSPPVFVPVPDPGVSINCDVAALIAEGMDSIYALRLLMLCGWSLARARAVLAAVADTDQSPVEFAKEWIRSETDSCKKPSGT